MENLIDTLLDFRDDFLDFYDDHKPLFIISVVLIVLLLVGGIVAYSIFAPVKIRIYSANEEVGDLLATKADSVTYYAIATRKGKQLDVDFSWSVDSGTVVEDNNGIEYPAIGVRVSVVPNFVSSPSSVYLSFSIFS